MNRIIAVMGLAGALILTVGNPMPLCRTQVQANLVVWGSRELQKFIEESFGDGIFTGEGRTARRARRKFKIA